MLVFIYKQPTEPAAPGVDKAILNFSMVHKAPYRSVYFNINEWINK